MAVKIRLKRTGGRKKPCNRIVVCDSKVARDGKFIEEIGIYNSCRNPQFVQIKKDRAIYWLRVGAKPSETVKNIFKKQGIKL